MAEEKNRGVGKCMNDHPASYGYPTRPEDPYPFCSKCGHPMVWVCPKCEASLPYDPNELAEARFCRHCGTPYFGDEQPHEPEPASADETDKPS